MDVERIHTYVHMNACQTPCNIIRRRTRTYEDMERNKNNVIRWRGLYPVILMFSILKIFPRISAFFEYYAGKWSKRKTILYLYFFEIGKMWKWKMKIWCCFCLWANRMKYKMESSKPFPVWWAFGRKKSDWKIWLYFFSLFSHFPDTIQLWLRENLAKKNENTNEWRVAGNKNVF